MQWSIQWIVIAAVGCGVALAVAGLGFGFLIGWLCGTRTPGTHTTVNIHGPEPPPAEPNANPRIYPNWTPDFVGTGPN